jgi:2-polyprenyl-3-methyl-5-hydroxy-6-metoxy-1,4-benzoquinol methylase
LPQSLDDAMRMTRPGPGYIHPRAGRTRNHTYGLEIATDSSPNYHRWITQLCRPHVGQRALEIGAGFGAVTRFLSEGVAEYVATDTSPECLAALESRFRGSPNVTVEEFDALTGRPCGRFDSIIMINVLEHLVDDSLVLQSLSHHLRPAGRLIIYVPALNPLYGEWDDMIGHVRRYSKGQLVRVMRAAGLAVVEARYVNLIAIPVWFAFSRLGIKRRQGTGTGGIGPQLHVWDRTAVPVTRWIESRLRPHLGLNALRVGATAPR